MRGGAHRTPFVGRQRELRFLLDRLETAGRGEGGVALVAGEPGIGKTRLLAELSDRAHANGMPVLWGSASDAGGMPPYVMFHEALRDYIRGCPPDNLRGQIGRGGASLAQLVPELRDRLPDLSADPPLSPEQERYRLFESVAEFLTAAARSADGGLLLILDDLHWADQSSLQLLHHLVRRISDVPLLIAGAYRPDDLDTTHPLAGTLAGLSRLQVVTQLSLPPLSAEETGDLIATISAAPVSAAALSAIQDEAEGNPFFIGEIVRHLQAEDRNLADSAPPAGWSVPESVRQVIGGRVARLHSATRRLLDAVAVLGDGHTFELIAATVGGDEQPLLDAVDEALRAGILEERTGGYFFTHALIRRTLYDGLSLARRQRLHLQVAKAVEAAGDRRNLNIVTALATHYRLAGPAARPGKALTYTMQAADAAEAVFAWEEAARERQLALDLLDGDGSTATPAAAIQRCELLRAQGVVLARAAKIPPAVAALKEAAALARTLNRPELFGQVILDYCDVPADPTRIPDQWAIDHLEEALRQLGDQATLLRPRVQACLARLLGLSDETERHLALGHAAVAAARRAGDPETLVYVLKHYYRILLRHRRHDALPAIGEEIAQMGQQMQRPEVVVEGLFWLFTALLEADDVAGAEAALDEHARLAEDIGFVFFRTQTAMWRAVWALMEGRIEESERLAQSALVIWQHAHGEATNTWYLTSIWLVLHRVALRRAQGRLAEVEHDVVDMAVRPAGAELLFGMLPAYIQSLTGRQAEARRELSALFSPSVADRLRPAYSIAYVTFLAEACANLKDRARAPAVYDLLRPFAGRNAVNWAYPICRGAVDHYLGLLAATIGDRPLAARHFEDALVMHARAGARYYLAETQHAYAALLLAHHRRGDLPRARLLLDEAIATYDNLGLDHPAAEARALLATAGDATAPPSRPHEPNGLTTREVEVLRLIAAGRSNRDIAAMLVISRYTVERHVNHIFAKTGAANRVEAAAYAHRHNLVE